MKSKIKTEWDIAIYDRSITLMLEVETRNIGTPNEFVSATPTDRQLRRVFGLGRIQLDTQGDDLTIYVNRERDGFPLGELHCTSHESLSPYIRAKVVKRRTGNEESP